MYANLGTMSRKSLNEAQERLKRAIANAEKSRIAYEQHREIEKKIFEACASQLPSCNIQKVQSSQSGEKEYSYLKSEHLLLWEKYLQCKQMPIVITGPNSSGKSTFINKIIGKRIMLVDEGSVSKRVVRITYADEKDATLEVYDNYKDGIEGCSEKATLTEPLTRCDQLLGKKQLAEIMIRHLKRNGKARVVEMKPEQAGGAGCDQDRGHQEDVHELDADSSDEEPVELTADKESMIWYQKMVVLRIPSEYLKMGVDIYDTPGPDLCDDEDVAFLRKNCSRLLQQLVPFSIVVFLLANESASNDVREAFSVLSKAIGTVEERQPRVYFLRNKYDLSALLNDQNISGSDSDKEHRKAVDVALGEARRSSLKTFRDSLHTPFLSDDSEEEALYDIVDMLDTCPNMKRVRKKVEQKLLNVAALHMESLTEMLVKGLCAAISNFYKQMENTANNCEEDIQAINKLMIEFKKNLKVAFQKQLKEPLDEFPQKLVKLLKEEGAGIEEDFQRNPIITKDKRVYEAYFDSHNEIKKRLETLVRERVIEKAAVSFHEDIGKKVANILKDEFSKLQQQGKYGDVLTDALDIHGIQEAIAVSGPSVATDIGVMVLSIASTAASIVLRVVVIDAVAAATAAALSVAFAAIGGVVFLGTVIYQVRKSTKKISQDRVLEWVRKKLSTMEKQYAKMDPQEILSEIEISIQKQIMDRLNDNLINFTNAKSMKAGIPALQTILKSHQEKIDQLHCDLSLMLGPDRNLSAKAKGCFHHGKYSWFYSSSCESDDIVFKTASQCSSAAERLNHEIVKLRFLKSWNISYVVPNYGVTKLTIDGLDPEYGQKPYIVYKKLVAPLQSHLAATQGSGSDFGAALKMATCIAEALISFSRISRRSRRSVVLNLDSSKLFVDESGSCFVSDFFSPKHSNGPYQRRGQESCPSPESHKDPDIWSLGVVLFELFPKKKYVIPRSASQVIKEVDTLRQKEGLPDDQSQYLELVSQCLSIEGPLPTPTNALSILKGCNMSHV